MNENRRNVLRYYLAVALVGTPDFPEINPQAGEQEAIRKIKNVIKILLGRPPRLPDPADLSGEELETARKIAKEYGRASKGLWGRITVTLDYKEFNAEELSQLSLFVYMLSLRPQFKRRMIDMARN